jgi:hypothetical protein
MRGATKRQLAFPIQLKKSGHFALAMIFMCPPFEVCGYLAGTLSSAQAPFVT